jgi:hypothetical protein
VLALWPRAGGGLTVRLTLPAAPATPQPARDTPAARPSEPLHGVVIGT